MTKNKLLAKIQRNNKNVDYGDFVTLIEAFNFRRTRGDGSHEIYRCKGVSEIVNIQNKNGKAKSYQIKQFLTLVEKYNLSLEDE